MSVKWKNVKNAIEDLGVLDNDEIDYIYLNFFGKNYARIVITGGKKGGPKELCTLNTPLSVEWVKEY